MFLWTYAHITAFWIDVEQIVVSIQYALISVCTNTIQRTAVYFCRAQDQLQLSYVNNFCCICWHPLEKYHTVNSNVEHELAVSQNLPTFYGSHLLRFATGFRSKNIEFLKGLHFSFVMYFLRELSIEIRSKLLL